MPEAVKFPAGYTLSQGGETEEQTEIFTQMIVAIGVAVMLMYFVLVVQFGSFLEPFAILLSLPLSLIGVMLALLVAGETLNIMSMIGVVLLMGIVAKNAILLIDFAKWSEEAGMERREALIQAGRVRLRPILMTTFALIAGMVPVALGSGEGGDFRAPLGDRGDRWRAHLHGPDAARDPDSLRDPRRHARLGHREAGTVGGSGAWTKGSVKKFTNLRIYGFTDLRIAVRGS